MKVHFCSSFGQPTKVGAQRGVRKGRPTEVVDVHCHVFSEKVEALVADRQEKRTEPQLLASALGEAAADYNSVMMSVLKSKLTNLDSRLSDMDAMGVGIQMLSPSPTQYYYWADIDLSEEIVRLQNDLIAESCKHASGRFFGIGAISFQHPALAIRQLEECVRCYQFKGVEISSNVKGKDIFDPEFSEFWARAEGLGVVVFIHPLGTTMGERLNHHYLANLVGNPLETAIALSGLIYSGILERHPALKVLAAHGGGFLPAYAGRFDHGWKVRPECQCIPRQPSSYLPQIYYDSIVHDPTQLRRLIDIVGASQVLLGSDYPFDMGDPDPIFALEKLALPADERVGILSSNAKRLFDI